jgi:dCMP deaminase
VNYHNDVIGTGYNGVPRNLTHCIDKPCPGANAPSGENLSECYAVHAEVNALLQCPNVYDVDTVYCTTAPCFECTKALLNSGAQRIVFVEDYPHSAKCKELWVQFGKEWIQFDG